MPTISMFRGIKVCIYWRDHMPSKQLKMLLGWAAFHQEELRENWELAREQQELFAIEPLK